MKQSLRKITITVGLSYIAWNNDSLIDNIFSYSLHLPMNIELFESIYFSIRKEVADNA